MLVGTLLGLRQAVSAEAARLTDCYLVLSGCSAISPKALAPNFNAQP